MREPAAPAIAALEEGRVRFHPERNTARDRLDWREVAGLVHLQAAVVGTPAAVWYCPDGHAHGRVEAPSHAASAAPTELRRESDVLDTWFSSALWPYATLGWPDETAELARYYPGNVDSTAREIIRLWENRMIWSGLELLGEVPFTDVIIHSTFSPSRAGACRRASAPASTRWSRSRSTAPTRRGTGC